MHEKKTQHKITGVENARNVTYFKRIEAMWFASDKFFDIYACMLIIEASYLSWCHQAHVAVVT